jgi:hypothetical protein
LTLVLSVLLWLSVSDYLFWYLQTFDPCTVCPSVIVGLWLPLLVSSKFIHRRTDNTGAKSLKIPKEVTRDRQSQKDGQNKGQKFEDTKRDNQRPSITEGQTTQVPKVWRYQEIIKDRQSQKDRQHKGQNFEDTKRGNQRPTITSVIVGLWLPLLVSSNFWPLCCLSFCEWRSLIISFGIFKHLAFVLSVLLWLTIFDYLFQKG